ncbi:hypothetical protein OG883_20545 [Streptomyces sp. NBC_01142]|uniref:hypothetical protein n=1 Tax=Streptomyces sp. NBC_01142 TaxID=2975865 RepID=UPI00224EB808|nr:hypothetical protein [Streptomyces sp. NBC_01142]MCX4822232.1 hypothetical protein [Streptomyces sp. NBC_01142]
MTRTPFVSASPNSAPPAVDRVSPGRARRVLRALAIASCVPYLALKTAWIAGSRIGIPDGSVLLEHRSLMIVANSITVLMDMAVVVLALLLTQPWGRRVKGRLLGLPIWVATGLLSPIMVGFPLQLAASAFGGTTAPESRAEPFLDDWVFGAVYGGFILQGLTLGALFLLYAKGRWSHLWQGRVWELPNAATGPFMRITAALGSLIVVFPTVMHLLWALGSTAGLSPARIDQRTTDLYLLEGVRCLFALAAVAGVLLLAFRRAPSLPVKTPLALAWVGSAALGAWGGWLLIATLMPETDEVEQTSGLMVLTYSVEMISGLLLISAVGSLLRRRGA